MKPNVYGNYTRDLDGVLVQAVNAAGKRRWLNPRGPHALSQACATIDSWAGEWRIEVISTPTTIYRDLQGSRRFSRKGMGETQLALPEPAMLAGIGRRDLWVRR